MKKLLFFVLLASFVAVTGCTLKNTTKGKVPTSSQEPATTKHTQPEQKLPDTTASADVAATVNGEKISRTDFERRLQKLAFVLNAQGQVIPGNTKEEKQQFLLNQVMSELVEETALMQAAVKEGVMPSDAEVQQIIDNIRSNFASEEEFQALVRSRGLTVANMAKYNRIQLIKERLAHKLGSTEKYNMYMAGLLKEAELDINSSVVNPLLRQQI